MSLGFGTDSNTERTKGRTTKESTEASSGIQSKQLKLDEDAIAKIIQDVLGGSSGLASVFGGEQNAGIFDSSVANQAAGNIVANLVGELAKITGEEVTTQESFKEAAARGTSRERTDGLETSSDFSFGL